MKHTILTKFSILIISALVIVNFAFARNASEVTPLLIGSEIPVASLVNKDGERIELSTILEGKRTIIIFYRGGWCPYCNDHMKELAEAEKELLDLGYQIIAISPDSPAHIASASKELNANYTLYSDSSLEVADAFGISFTLADQMVESLASYGIDLAAHSDGLNENRLPVPSVFISTPDGHVSFQYADPNYRYRIPGDLLVAAAKASIHFHQKN